jgi:hypothetical protein
VTRPDPPPPMLEYQRVRCGADADALWAWCANTDCVELLFYSPDYALPFQLKGQEFRPVCSPDCAMAAARQCEERSRLERLVDE